MKIIGIIFGYSNFFSYLCINKTIKNRFIRIMETIKGEEIIRLWKRAEELSHAIPSNKMYSGDYINKTNEFKATNSIFGCCYFKPCGYNVSFRMANYDAKGWNMHEYVGLYGRATEIRYIKPNEEYEIDL